MKMNSSEGVHKSNGDPAESPSCSNVTDENSNTDIKTPEESRGAVPKTTFGVLHRRKSRKANNNVEGLEDLNGTLVAEEVQCNGYSANIITPEYPPEEANSENRLRSFPKKSRSLNDVDKLNSASDISLNELINPVYEGNCSCVETDSSSDDNEILSVSDDGCIYTYKGDHDDAADLPSSFFNIALPPLEEDRQQNYRNNASSPEMDFLEMDFDPGPSGDADSDTASNADADNATCPPIPLPSSYTEEPKVNCSTSMCEKPIISDINKPQKDSANVTSVNFPQPQVNEDNSKVNVTYKLVEEIKMPWSCSLSERTKTGDRLRTYKKHLSPRGDLISPSDGSLGILDNTQLVNDTSEKTMIWSLEEACLKQISQIAPSSCGATAVLNVLNALRLPLPSVETIQAYIHTKFRANSAPLAKYLISRSRAGCGPGDLMLGLYHASGGQIYSRFFTMYPERVVNLQKWLGYWIKNGAIPIATLNLQKCEGVVPDSWHHQMIFGVDEDSVYLTNPIERVEASLLWPQLCSESVLLIRREDVVLRFNPKIDLPELMSIEDTRWEDFNVVGQIAHIIRESRRQTKVGFTNTSHIKIPFEYKAGITLAIDVGSPAYKLLHQCPELPLLHPDDAATALYT